MKILYGVVVGVISAVLVVLCTSIAANAAQGSVNDVELPGPEDPSGVVVDPVEEVTYRIKCGRSYTILDVESGGTVRLIPSKRCGGPVGSFTATDDMSFVYATRLPGQKVMWHRLRVKVRS